MNKRNLIKQVIGFISKYRLCTLSLSLSLASCQKSHEPLQVEVPPKVTQKLSLELSSELDPEEVGLSAQELRSMAFTTGDSKPQIHGSLSDWKGHLFFRKKKDDSFVGYAAIAWKVSYDREKKKFVLRSTTDLNLEHAPALPALDETWYVAAVLGGGTLSEDKKSINFMASGVQESESGITRLDVPFVSNWTRLTIKKDEKGELIREAHFKFSPKGFITRATITNDTNYDYRIYRNKSVNGRLSPELPRLAFSVLDASTETPYRALVLDFSSLETPDASLVPGAVVSSSVAQAVVDNRSIGAGVMPIYPDPTNPITLKANGKGSCNVLLWSYSPARDGDLRLIVGSALPQNFETLFIPPFFKRTGSQAQTDGYPKADYAVKIPAARIRDGKSFTASFSIARRAMMPIDFLITNDEEHRLLGAPSISDGGLLDPIEYYELRRLMEGYHPAAISGINTLGLSYIFPQPATYESTAASDFVGTADFTYYSNQNFISFKDPIPYVTENYITRDRYKSMGDGKPIYGLRFMPTTVNQVGDILSIFYSPETLPQSIYDDNPDSPRLPPYTDGDRQSAYRYEYTTYPGSSTRKALKVTARYLGNAWTGSIEDIASPSFWDNNSDRNVEYYFPANGGYLPPLYSQGGNFSGSFLGRNNNYRDPSGKFHKYYMVAHGFSEYGLWGERYIAHSYPSDNQSLKRLQTLDYFGFGVVHYASPAHMDFYKYKP